MLAQAGLPVTAESSAAFLAAIEQVDVADPAAVYWAGRVTLCGRHDDLWRYDEAFACWFTGSPRPGRAQQEPASRRSRNAVIAPLTGSRDGEGQQHEAAAEELHVAASDTEVLRHRDIAELSESERAHLRELLATLHPGPPLRSSPRRREVRHGTLDARRTLRRMLATGGEPVRLLDAARSVRPRRVVLLVDVSGSMAPYADALLRFCHVLARANPASTEVFSLGTRMTRLTRALRGRDPELAMSAAARTVPDWAGGTRLGETLRVFLTRYGQRGLARGAVVVLFSDGWERGGTELLAAEMARLRRLAHAVLWVNPHAGLSGYQPVQSGITVALPYVDTLLAGHSLATLQRLVNEVRDA